MHDKSILMIINTCSEYQWKIYTSVSMYFKRTKTFFSNCAPILIDKSESFIMNTLSDKMIQQVLRGWKVIGSKEFLVFFVKVVCQQVRMKAAKLVRKFSA